MRYRLRHKRLARELAAKGISQNRWAQRLGLGRGHLSLLVNGKRPFPSPRTRRKLLDGLDLCVQDLFEVERTARPYKSAGETSPYRRTPSALPAGQAGIGVGRRGSNMESGWRSDLRLAFRLLERNPVFALSMVLVLALGLGPNLAVFSVLDAVLLRQLPYRQADRLATIGPPLEEVSPNELLDLRRRSRLARSVAAWQPREVLIAGRDGPTKVRAAIVSRNLFDTLGVQPVVGADFDHSAHDDAVAIISHGLWIRRFGGDNGLVGEPFLIDGKPHSIAAVMPAGFQLPDDIQSGRPSQIWLPLNLNSVDPGSRGFKEPNRKPSSCCGDR